MPKVSASHKLAQRERILDATLSCFQQKGYHGTSVSDISVEAGVSAGTIYNYFSGKQEVVREVALNLLEDARDEFAARRLAHTLTPAEVARTILAGFSPPALDALLVQLNAESTRDPQLGAIMREVLEAVRQTIAGALADWAAEHPDRVSNDPDVWGMRVAPVIASLAAGFLLQRALCDDFDTEGFLQALSLILPAD